MKILSLHFKNINSLRGEYTIDFAQDPLNNAGIFAITGATGSGKTTILDVITLALYNRIARLGIISKGQLEKTGAIMTRNTGESYAEVTYSCKRGTFTSKWSISLNRNGKWRDYEMELAEDSATLLDIKKSQIPSKNEELIGLNYEQFVRSVMLVQGDFAQFLQAKKDERGGLLEKITGGEIYKLLGKRAFEKKREHASELEKLQVEHQRCTDEKISGEELYDLTMKLDDNHREIVSYEQRGKLFEKEIEQKRELIKLAEKLQQLAQEFSQKKSSLKKFESEKGERMQRHQSLLPLESFLRDWQESQRQWEKHLEKEDTLVAEVENAQQTIETAKMKVMRLLGRKVDDAQLLDELATLEKKVTELETNADKLLASCKPIKDRAEKLSSQQSLSWKINFANSNSVKSFYTKALEEEQTFSGQIEKARAELDLSTQSVQEKRMWLLQTKDLVKDQQHQQDTVESLGKEVAQLEVQLKTVEEALGSVPKKLEEECRNLETAELRISNLEKDQKIRQLTQTLEEHRQHLEAGKPCPLCGSTEHPYSEQTDLPSDDLSKKIEEQKKAQQQLQKTVAKLESDLDHLRKEQTLLVEQQHRKSTDFEKEQSLLKEILKSIPEEFRQSAPLETLKKLEDQLTKVEAFVHLQERKEKLNELAPLLKEFLEKTEKWKEVIAEKKKLYQGGSIREEANDLRESWINANNRFQNATKNKEDWEREKKELVTDQQQLINSLLPKCRHLGYEAIERALENLMPSTDFQKLQQEEHSLKNALIQVETQLKGHEQDKNEKEANALFPDIGQEELKEQLNECKAQLSSLKEEQTTLLAKQRRQEEIEQKLKELEVNIAQQKSQNKKWLLLAQYIGDAEGKKFSTFAQQLTLQQLVVLANRRLKGLNERYQLTLPEENEEDNLVVIDNDLGGQRRSVKTLSGGETFLVSLALALGLSDLASREVEINSLFIDEGFGTLDPEVLDQTLDTLEKLQMEHNKTIGIISHVAALKERITTQIQLEKNGQGFSSLKVVAALN